MIMQKIALHLSIGLILVAFTIGVAVGYFLTPEYRTTMYEKTAIRWTSCFPIRSPMRFQADSDRERY